MGLDPTSEEVGKEEEEEEVGEEEETDENENENENDRGIRILGGPYTYT